MKKLASLTLALALLTCLAACAGDAPPPEARMMLSGKIIEIYDGTMLVSGEDGGLYIVPFVGEGLEPSGSPLAAGGAVEISYATAAESYPVQLEGVTEISVSQSPTGDLVGLYLEVTADLWRDGDGLTSDIDVIGFNLSEAANLTDGEKAALLYIAKETYGFETIEGTFDELKEQGYIEKDQPIFFPRGVLISFGDMVFEENGFTFGAMIWRGGTAAIIYGECTAVFEGGEWSYTPGGWAIA